ncbi:hypothetical protein, partial [Tsukamurella asaccharolytica]|uniref:hypothetical protein n=1 Tax=Tsukamurella asaccharolytica TaxID=2592067 RepID=UPI00196031DE
MRYVKDIDYYRRSKQKGSLKRWLSWLLLLLIILAVLILIGVFRQDSVTAKGTLSEAEMEALIPKG